jgi:3-hydroxybutyryl-CoA dehydrogenase
MEVNVVGVAGLGLLGRGIASCLLAHGISVVAYDVSSAERVKARVAINTAIAELIERGYCDASLQQSWTDLYTEADSLNDFEHCGFIIESIIESSSAKGELFDRLEDLLPADTPIASNTSALPITLLQQGRKHPERFVGMHWAEPAHATRFLELIRGDETADACLEAAFNLSKRLGKDPCVVQRDIPGFIANRIGYAMYREACNLLNSGVADAETIDRSFRNSVGLWATVCGPFRWIDLTGGPAVYGRAMAGVLPTLSNETEVPEPIRSMIKQGAAGMRDGNGFFDYTPQQVEQWEEIYRRQAWRVREIAEETAALLAEVK